MNKRLNYSPSLKKKVWNKYFDEEYSIGKCLCCKSSVITYGTFHKGHITSIKNGGTTTIDNLKPICNSCHINIGSDNMDTLYNYVKKHKKIQTTDDEIELLQQQNTNLQIENQTIHNKFRLQQLRNSNLQHAYLNVSQTTQQKDNSSCPWCVIYVNHS